MSTLMKCDKCGKIDNNYVDFKFIKAFSHSSFEEIDRLEYSDRMDVCDECYKKIFKIKEDN